MPILQRILSFSLINSTTEQPILTLTNGDKIDLAAVGKTLNIRPNCSPRRVGSVVSSLSGRLVNSSTDNRFPYSVFGDVSGNFNNWEPSVGLYTLTARPYSLPNGGGRAGRALTINFEVIDSSQTVPVPPTRVFYASPNGTGNGTISSPFRIANFWSIAQPGDELILTDGTYIGASSMITPPQGLSGTADKRITIRALNDGKVDIDGQGVNRTFEFDNNNYFTVEGINVHDPGEGSNLNISPVFLSDSSHNILRRICAWEAKDGNTNIFGIHHGDYNLLEDCAGWGTARKTFSNSQQGNYTTFRRCFGRWEGSHATGPKKVFGLSYNSYNALAENCIATWDGLKMQQNYELHEYDGSGMGQFFTNYTVQQPDGLFSHDGFDIQPDVANIRIYGCISYLKSGQRFHNSTKKHAGPYAFEIKGVDIKDSIAYIEPGSHTDIQRFYFSSPSSNNTANNITAIGGASGTLSSSWTSSNIHTASTCGTITNNNKTIFDPNGLGTSGARIINRYVDGVLTTTPLWPWPMNQRIIDAMTQGGYTPIDVTSDIYTMCGGSLPSNDSIIQKAKQWLTSTGAARTALEADLTAWTTSLDSIISAVKPSPTKTQTGEIFYQGFTNPVFQSRYPDHQYHMYVPTHYNPSTPFGLMLWLHGGGSWDATEIDHLAAFDMDNEKVTGRSYPRTETDTSNYILVAPIAPFGSVIPHPQHASRWNVPGADQYLMDIITEVSTNYNINFNKVVLAGFSMGGVGAYHQALRLNDRLAAVMASAGSWKLGSWADLKNMPMYLIHGVTDAFFNASGCRNHHTAIEYARHAFTRLSAGSGIHLKNEYPGGHSWDSTAEGYWDTFINGQTGWVTSKTRDPYRSNVVAHNPWRSYDVGSNFNVSWNENASQHTLWASINTTSGGNITYDYAQVVGNGSCTSQATFNDWALNLTSMNYQGSRLEATIVGANQIDVTTTNVTQFSLWLHPSMANINLANPIQVRVNGGAYTPYNATSNLLTALKSYERRWDWGMIYHAQITINV